MVFIIAKNGQPLMPTSRHGKVKHLLKQGKAIVVNNCPFTIKLTYGSKMYTQDITLGVDAGSKSIGISASTESKELFTSEITLRNDIVKLLSEKRQYRRTRRNRLRYRKPRFLNRKKTKQQNWLAPSIRHKINSHLKIISDIHKILPVTKIITEVASFDIQKIKNPDISGTDYQNGEQLNFWNVREYVLFRDNHICQHCKGKSKDKILNVHHIESRQTGGNAPNNLITLCKTCHKKHHKNLINFKIPRKPNFKHETFMGIMRWAFYNKLKELYPDVNLTYGYLTKNTRILNDLAKSYSADAFCIANNLQAIRTKQIYFQKFVRCNNRSLHKANLLKNNVQKSNKLPYLIHNFHLFDKVCYENQICFIFGRRTSGYFDLRLLDNTKIHASASYKRLKLLKAASSLLIQKGKHIPLRLTEVGVSCVG